MKVYLAGSYTHKSYICWLGSKLRQWGHKVYVFCDEGETACKASEELRNSEIIKTITPQSAMSNQLIRFIGSVNLEELEKADCVIVALPCGKSAHLEAGWAKGKGKFVMIYGDMKLGEFDAMYIMADGIYDSDEFVEMINHMRAYEESKREGIDDRAYRPKQAIEKADQSQSAI